ncbi:MAG: DUF4124 domain-containing protein [Betaproteobacteria bacterium]
MRALIFVVVLCLSCAGAPAGASVYKCAGDQGAVVYQDAPCGAGRELRNFDIDPPALTVIPGTQAAAAPPAARSGPERSASPTGDGARQQADDKRAAERKFARSGMTEAEILQRLGRPDVTTGGSRKSGRRWAYLPRPGDPDTMTTLTLEGGNVVDVERKLVR